MFALAIARLIVKVLSTSKVVEVDANVPPLEALLTTPGAADAAYHANVEFALVVFLDYHSRKDRPHLSK